MQNLVRDFQDIVLVAASHSCSSVDTHALATAYERLRIASLDAKKQVFDDPRVGLWIDWMGAELALQGGILSDAAAEALIRDINVFATSAHYHDHPSRNGAFGGSNDEVVELPALGVPTSVRVAAQSNRIDSLSRHGHFVPGPKPALVLQTTSGNCFEVSASDPLLAPPPHAIDIVPLEASRIQRDAWQAVLGGAAHLIALSPSASELAKAFGSIIVPLDADDNDTDHCSVTFSARPGVLYMSWSDSVETIAEAIVHESDHQFFYGHSRDNSIWNDVSAVEHCIFRSPWRSDPRPLDGLVRGASAFIRVAEFWTVVQGSDAEVELDVRRIQVRAVLALQQSLDAIRVIRRYGSMTNIGRDLVDALWGRASHVMALLERHAEFRSWAAIAQHECDEHDQAWRLRHCATDRDRIASLTEAIL